MNKKWLLVITLGLALILAVPTLTGCGGPVAAQAPFFPVQLDKYASEPYPSATATGTMVIDNGYLRLKTPEGTSNLLIWPPGFSISVENDVVRIADKESKMVISVGDLIEATGGQVPAETVEKYTGKDLPRNSTGPYWLASKVRRVPSSVFMPHSIPARTDNDSSITNSPSQVQISQQPQGIWVSGTGEVAVTPDIAILRLGIVSQQAAVAEAQAKASEAMTKVMQSLTDSGIASKDIQTGSFSINQRTRWDDQKQMETITGYQVTNMVTVKIRDAGKVGNIIDSVVLAGGDLIRISGISFTVEDPLAYYQQAREKAMTDARNKAQQLAILAGLTLGKPTYVAEGAQSSPVYSSLGGGMAIPAPTIVAQAPPISSGETRITLNVQVAFSVTQ